MPNLISFSPPFSDPNAMEPLCSGETLLLEADLQFKDSSLYLEFGFLEQSAELFELPKTSASWPEAQVPRQDGLWQATCFEAFLSPLGSSKYFEFNFSLNPAWNAYKFESYRLPQPAAPTEEFVLKSMGWDAVKKRLLVELENKTFYSQFRVGLTAILLEKNGTKHYCALAHKGTQPDFHLMKSFILQRGTEE
ncbi:MAG TPA: hypothetical protein VIG33_08695 [Pseudobdellovibrionaceae bacterium]|jgi:hypothetical protein